MPTQRLEEKRVEECASARGVGGGVVEREREREHTHVGERERKECMHAGERKSTWLLLLYVFFPLGLPCANWTQPGVLFYLKFSL